MGGERGLGEGSRILWGLVYGLGFGMGGRGF